VTSRVEGKVGIGTTIVGTTEVEVTTEVVAPVGPDAGAEAVDSRVVA